MSQAPARPRPVVHPTADDARLDETLYAINFLDRTRPWAYETYNLLAFPAARGVGARPLAKGVDGSCWVGDPSLARETLLIVSYGNAGKFLRMATNPYFALVSAFRKLGLSRFQFGFSRRLDEATKRPRRRKGELLAILWSEEEPDLDLTDLQRRVSAAGSRILFVGAKKAILALDRGGKRGVGPTSLAPPLPWSSVAVVAGTEHTLRPLADDLPPGASVAVHYRQVF